MYNTKYPIIATKKVVANIYILKQLKIILRTKFKIVYVKANRTKHLHKITKQYFEIYTFFYIFFI